MTVAAFLARFWREALLTALLLILTITIAAYTASGKRKDAALQACRDASEATVANFKRATAEAKAADIANARTVEQRYASIAEDQSHALQDQLTRARADAAAFADRLRAQARAPGGSGVRKDLPVATQTAGRADAADPVAVMAQDANACATAYVIATGFQDWVRAVNAPADGSRAP